MEKDKSFERDPIVFSISLITNYSEEYLEKLSDAELLEVYERVSNK